MPVNHLNLGTVMVLALFTISFAQANELASPNCEDLAAWTDTIDPKSRWEPFSENRRLWLPEAMAQPRFAALFGKPAVDWTQADVASARTTWSGCIQQAKKARDRSQQKLLQSTRRYLTSNLRDVARYQESRAQPVTQDQALRARQARAVAEREAAGDADKPSQAATPTLPVSSPTLRREVDNLIKAPASVDTLIALGSLSRMDLNDADAMEKLESQFGHSRGPAASAAYSIMRELRIRGSEGFDARERPRIDNRLPEIRPDAFAMFKSEFAQAPTDIYQQRALAQRYEKIMAQLKVALTEEEYLALADETRKERTSLVDRAIADAKAKIDRVPAGAQSIPVIDRIVGETAKMGLDTEQRRDLVKHALSRQEKIANDVLNHATETELPALPDTLAGIRELNAISTRMLRGVVQKADKEVIQRFVSASDARLAEIGRKALPEYEKALARLPESEAGLAQADREVADKEGWNDMEEQVRGEYIAIAKTRRDAIAVVVDKERAQRNESIELERKRAVAAGGDPRLVGTEWVDSNNTMKFDFRDHETVFINALGLKTAGTYKVSRDDVVVRGPHGQLAYTLDGNRLTGNGMVFRKTR